MSVAFKISCELVTGRVEKFTMLAQNKIVKFIICYNNHLSVFSEQRNVVQCRLFNSSNRFQIILQYNIYSDLELSNCMGGDIRRKSRNILPKLGVGTVHAYVPQSYETKKGHQEFW